MVLKEVVIKDKRQVVKYSSNLNGAGNADQVITSDQLSACATLDMCFGRQGDGGYLQKRHPLLNKRRER